MAELDLRSRRKGKTSYEAVVTNLGPDTVILSKIEGAGGVDRFFVGPPLHRSDLELIKGGRHQFMVAPSLADELPLEVDITFTDGTGERKKTYPHLHLREASLTSFARAASAPHAGGRVTVPPGSTILGG
jgi:hypothetical protein